MPKLRTEIREEKEVKYCKDCAYCITPIKYTLKERILNNIASILSLKKRASGTPDYDNSKCKECSETNIITGKILMENSWCLNARAKGGYCGREAFAFKAKE